MNKIFIYYHVFLAGNWLEIMKEQIDCLVKSELYQNSCIKLGALHEARDLTQIPILKSYIKNYENIQIQFIKENTGWAESETLAILKDDCDKFEKNRNVLYLHVKGVTQHNTEKQVPVANWRRMMEYFLVENWRKCILKLKEGYDCCGINHQIHAGNIYGKVQGIHIFNGNFFWANSDYIKKLDRKILFEHRYSSENFICSLKDNKAYSFYNSPIKINLYYESNNEYRTKQ